MIYYLKKKKCTENISEQKQDENTMNIGKLFKSEEANNSKIINFEQHINLKLFLVKTTQTEKHNYRFVVLDIFHCLTESCT